MSEPRKIMLVFATVALFGLFACAVQWLWDAGRRWLALVVVGLVVLILLLSVLFSHARDLGQWENGDPVVREWYKSLMQPDSPSVSCCGEADAYWCDAIKVRDGKNFCTITDDREDAPLKRPHIQIGTEVEIPNHKFTYRDGNPTGHSIVFMNPSGYVYCFVVDTLS